VLAGLDLARILSPVSLWCLVLLSINCFANAHPVIFNVTRRSDVSFAVSHRSVQLSEGHSAQIHEVLRANPSSWPGKWDWHEILETPIHEASPFGSYCAVTPVTSYTHDVSVPVRAGFELESPRVPRLRTKKPTERFRKKHMEHYVPAHARFSCTFRRRKLPYHLVLRCYRRVGNRPKRIGANQKTHNLTMCTSQQARQAEIATRNEER